MFTIDVACIRGGRNLNTRAVERVSINSNKSSGAQRLNKQLLSRCQVSKTFETVRPAATHTHIQEQLAAGRDRSDDFLGGSESPDCYIQLK